MELSEIHTRRAWFEEYTHESKGRVILPSREGVDYTCPCCGYPTLGERGGYEICEICDWEDDGQDDAAADEVWGGPNGNYSLTEARTNFASHLTMYRERDKSSFRRETTTKRLEHKKKLIKQFEALRPNSSQA